MTIVRAFHTGEDLSPLEVAFIKYYYESETFDLEHGVYNPDLKCAMPLARHAGACAANDRKLRDKYLPGVNLKDVSNLHKRVQGLGYQQLKTIYLEVCNG